MASSIDINQCSGNPGLCDVHATCTVLANKYVCRCPTGFSGDGFKAGTGCTGIRFQKS